MALAGKWGGRHKKKINGQQEYVYYGIRLKDKTNQGINGNGNSGADEF